MTTTGCRKARRAVSRPLTATVISSGELERMRKGGPSPEEQLAAQRQAELRREAELVERRRREQQEDDKRRQRQPQTESERLKAAEDAAIRARASLQLEEERDEVKRMNRMMLYSRCVTIRDKQIEEKRKLWAEEAAQQRALDADMEVLRRRQLAAQEETDKVRYEQRRAGMAVLEEQLQEREEQRRLAEEQRHQEQIRINEAIAAVKARDALLVEERRAAGAALLRGVMAGNATIIERKAAEKQRDAEEDRRILAYIRERDAKAQAALEEKARLARTRELETAQLRALQERAQDRQSQLDELRAQRWQEAAARRDRERERATLERAGQQQKAIADARQAQAASKVLVQAAMAKVEEAEFQVALAKAWAEQQALQAQEAELAAAKKAHLAHLQNQVEANEQAKQAAKAAHTAEGQKIKEALEREKATIEAIRQKKLQQLEADGVPAKYRTELARENFVRDRLK